MALLYASYAVHLPSCSPPMHVRCDVSCSVHSSEPRVIPLPIDMTSTTHQHSINTSTHTNTNNITDDATHRTDASRDMDSEHDGQHAHTGGQQTTDHTTHTTHAVHHIIRHNPTHAPYHHITIPHAATHPATTIGTTPAHLEAARHHTRTHLVAARCQTAHYHQARMSSYARCYVQSDRMAVRARCMEAALGYIVVAHTTRLPLDLCCSVVPSHTFR